ncbi:MAG: hypothetical protein HQ498_07095 [Pseudohongiella sp.]|nr:hypothetical protein [Pseudohongiella sp.]
MKPNFRQFASCSFFVGTLLFAAASVYAESNDSYNLTNDASYISGKIETRQHIYYPGDTLDVRLSFGGDTALLVSQGVEAYVVAFDQSQTSSAIKIDDYSTFSTSRLFFLDTVSTEAVAEGSYQLALILVRTGGDPTHIDDWYNGFAGLLDTDAVYSSSTTLEGDVDQDGEWDGDKDRDGFYGDDDTVYEYYNDSQASPDADSADIYPDRDWNDDDWDSDSSSDNSTT